MKKITSIILAFCLLLSVWTIVPVSAAKVTDEPLGAITESEKVGIFDKYYDTFSAGESLTIDYKSQGWTISIYGISDQCVARVSYYNERGNLSYHNITLSGTYNGFSEIGPMAGSKIVLDVFYGEVYVNLTLIQGPLYGSINSCDKYDSYGEAMQFIKAVNVKQYFTTSIASNTFVYGDEVTCAVSKTEGNLKGDSYSNGQSCPILRWVSSDESVIKVTDSHAEYSRAEVKAVGYGTATLTFYVGSVKQYEATLNVISPAALKDNATVTILKQANKNSTNILCNYNGWDKTKFVVADTTLTFFSDMSGTFVKQAKQAFGQMGDDTDLAQDDVIKDIMENYFEYSDSKSDAVSEFKENWKYVKTGMKLAKTVYDDSKNETQAKKTIAKAVKKASNVKESDFDKVFKKFKTVKNVVGDSLTLYELSATAIMLEEFDKEIVWELMNSFDTSSSTYRALERLYDDMEADPVGYVIDNFVDEKITQLLEKLVDAAFAPVEMPKAVVETAFSILSIIYEKTGGVTVKAFDQATVAADFAEEALSALTSCTDSSKREMLFNYCTSAARVELNKCIAVCKSDSTTLKSKANDSLNKVNKLTYAKYIQNCVDEYNNPGDVKFENPDLERYKISAKFDIKTNYKSVESVGATIDETQEDSNETRLVIPSSTEDYLVTAISENGFSNLSGITTIYVPNSIQQIGARAFYNCADTKEITLGGNVAVIGDEAFMDCASLTDINLGVNLQSIGRSAFENCSSLGEIKLAKDVTALGENAFAGCSALESVYIFNGNLSIPENAFDGCDNLTIYGYSGSTAENYAVNHNIAFESIGDLISVFEIVGSDNIKLAYGESLDTSKLSLNLTYSDGRKETVSEGFTVLYDNTTAGTQTAVVIYGNSYQTFELEVTETTISQIAFEEQEINVVIGDTINPAVSFSPDSAQRPEYVLTSSDESVLGTTGTGFVALKEGKAEITATALDGSLSAKCVVEVSNIVATNCDDDLTDTIFFVAPETKEYTFYINNENAVIDVYDGDMEALENTYDSGESISEKTVFTVKLTADDIYVIQVSGSQNQDLIIGNPEDEPAFVLGDVNGDGEINIADATAVQKHIAQLITLEGDNFKAADANGDGVVNIADATAIQKYIAQLIDHLG